jgi:hypothetical protein
LSSVLEQAITTVLATDARPKPNFDLLPSAGLTHNNNGTTSAQATSEREKLNY